MSSKDCQVGSTSCNPLMDRIVDLERRLTEAEARIGEHEGSCPFCSTSPTYRHLCVRWAELRRATEPKEPAMPRKLARFQSCGCNLCVCEDEDQCQGCGAIHCGTHPVGQFPNPLYVEEKINDTRRA
jgi:hypothetical protein